MTLPSCAVIVVLLLPLMFTAACGGGAQPAATSDSITLYTCVSDTTIQPVIKQFEAAKPGRKVNLYRAPTGDLNARVAGDVRSGGLKADVIWACDPLTMADYVSQGLVGGWTPQTDIAQNLRTADSVGVAMLYMVAVSHEGGPTPQAWSDLTSKQYAGKVAVPDPKVAASALGALGFFAQSPNFKMDFYANLKKNGAVQVSTPDNVTTGVAEGVYQAGVTVANSAYTAQKKGSPIRVVWPQPGAIGIYGPAALAKNAANPATAKDFISYITSKEGQTVIGGAGSYPALADIKGPTKPAGAKVVSPDWSALATQKDTLLKDYQQIFGGS
ncbi:MAG: extracellular solute-binding protein [Propionibacteriaceae bacterium]|nr:extracellular solute-binding protein [Propionibacteriaceae bacterium]